MVLGEGVAGGGTVPERALVGHLFYEDGSCMPAVFLEVSGDGDMADRLLSLYRTQRLSLMKLRFDEDAGQVSLEAVKDLLDGGRLVDLIVKFQPEDSDDIAAFLGLMEYTHSWVLIIRLPKIELHFTVWANDDSVMGRYASRHVSEVRKFNVKAGS
jgi:hypothetical protein